MSDLMRLLAASTLLCVAVSACGGGARIVPADRTADGTLRASAPLNYVRRPLDRHRILNRVAGDHIEIETIAGMEQFPPGARVYKHRGRIYVAQRNQINSYTASGVSAAALIQNGMTAKRVSLEPIDNQRGTSSTQAACSDDCEIINGPPSAGCDASHQSCPICPECSGQVPAYNDPAECYSVGCGPDSGGFVLRFGGPYGYDENGAACTFSFTGDVPFQCFDDIPEWLSQFITPNVAVSYIYYLSQDIAVLTCGPASMSRSYGGAVHYREIVTPNFTRVADKEFRDIPAGVGIEATFGPPAGPNSTVRGTFIARLGTRIAANCNASGALLAP